MLDSKQSNGVFAQKLDVESIENSSNLAQSMSLVYFWMILGLMITAVVAYLVWQAPLVQGVILGNEYIFYGLLTLQLAMIFVFCLSYKKAGFLLALLMYIVYSALTGMTLSVIFLVYQFDSIVSVLISTSFAFLGLCIFGYTTNRDLGILGTFCLFGLIGLIGLNFLSFFIPSFKTDMANMILSSSGVIIFSGLTAYDTQKIKKNLIGKKTSLTESINYALGLYLDFLNLFLKLLELFGKRR